MESHNGLTNGVNGTTEIKVEEHLTTVEVKTIQSSNFTTSEIQQKVSTTEIVDIQESSHQPEIIHPEIHQPIAYQSDLLSIPANESASVASPEEAIVGAVLTSDEVTQPMVVTASEEVTHQPEVVIATPEVTNQPEVVVAQQEVTHQPEVVVAQQEVTHQPEVVIAPLEVTPQPDVVIATQEIIAENADSTPQPEVVSAPEAVIEASHKPELLATPPQAINGGSEFTREANDASAITLQGVLPGTEFTVPQYAISALNQVATTEGFSNYVINYERGSNLGDGFVAEIVRAKINGSQLIKGEQQDSELTLVLKLPPENKTRREQMGMNVFEREVMAYNEILPMFQKFQLDKGLKSGQGFVSFPKCYYASFSKEKDEAVIIMEDIRTTGFKMQNKYKPVDYPHAKAVLETIAQFHGLSLAMKDQCPGVFEKFKGLKDVLVDGMMNDMMKSVTAINCQKALETLEPHEENIKQKLRAFRDNIIDIVQTCANGELSEPYTVLNHGDCWINNMMFKYQSGFPTQLCLLDWQVVRYASPVLDICYFIYLCTDSALRAKDFDTLIQGYHIALRKQVELLGSDVNQILPFTALLREMKSKAKFALSTALFIIPMLCTPNAELPNIDELVETLAKGEINEDNKLFHMTSDTENTYKIRMSGLIRDMHKKGYL